FLLRRPSVVECSYQGSYMKTASVRDLKNRTSVLLREAGREDVLITSRRRPVACLVGVTGKELAVLPRRSRRGLSLQDKERIFRIASRLWKLKRDRGKKWVSQRNHDQVLYADGAA